MRAASTYRRSAGTPRALERRSELLDAVSEDLVTNGVAGFSLRRAARAAGTTHKVLLYHFDGVEDLLQQALQRLRARRIDKLLTSAGQASGTLGERVRALWPVLADNDSGLRVIDEAIGLAMADPVRYRHLAGDATRLYLGPLEAMCPPEWTPQRRHEVASMILAAFRGFLTEWRTTRDSSVIDPGLDALARMLDAEVAR